MLNAQDAEALRSSWGMMADARREAALQFLQRLFAEAPGLRSRFPEDTEAGIRRLLALVDFLVEHAGECEVLVHTLQGLGRRHLDEAVGRRELHAVGMAWMWTLERRLGPELTPPRLLAWSQLLAFSLRTLRESAPALAS
jgi:nitric oxide dioxygenase